METRVRKRVAKCPHCGNPHAYSEVRFPAVNDEGYWKVECEGCDRAFIISIKNPRESAALFRILERVESSERIDSAKRATDIVEHNLDTNRTSQMFDYSAAPLYLCQSTGKPVEELARDAFLKDLESIESAYAKVVNYALASRSPPYRHLVAHVAFNTCDCGQLHAASFYTKFIFDLDAPQPADAYVLAGVSGCDLQDRLDGLFSKTDVMAVLEKLLIRWHLTSDQIVVAVPFVGHTYLSKPDKMSLWSWLLSKIDPEVGVFITRSKTFADYKTVLEDVDGLNHAILDEYGLASKLIAANIRKQDFHAKFFIGIGQHCCEVLSGSANIVKGPSVENLSFRSMSMERCQARYIEPLNLTLPAPRQQIPYVLVSKNGHTYRSEQSSACPLPA